MQLFSTDQILLTSQDAILITETPFCTISPSLRINGKTMSEIPVRSAFKADDDKTAIFAWSVDGCHIECLKSKLSVRSNFNVEHINLWSYIWRIHNGTHPAHIELSCGVKFGKSLMDGFINTGEHLIAKTWEGNNSAISIGTEDYDVLFSRAGSEWMPARFFKADWPSAQSKLTIHTFTNDLTIALPVLLNEEKVQLQFLYSWAAGENAGTATWYAVDRNPREILEELAFR